MILTLAFVVGVSFAAYAEVQNIKVSGDIEVMSVFRENFDLAGKDEDDGSGNDRLSDLRQKNENIFLTFARIRTDADLTDNVSASIRLLSEFIWGREDSTNSNYVTRDSDRGVYLDLAYITLKEFLYSPLTLVVGRQELHYGNDMIIGDSSTNRIDWHGSIPSDLSKRKAFDAVRAILDYNPLTVDLVYSKIRSQAETNLDANSERVGDYRDDDTDLYGINAKYDFGRKNLIAEGYYWYRRIGPRAYTIGTQAYHADQLHTIGARVSAEPIENLTAQVEYAIQRGRYNGTASDTADRHVNKYFAYALETSLTYNWKKAKYTPSLTALFAQFSGESVTDNSDRTNRYRGWDPMYENQTFGRIANALMAQSNVRLVGLAGSFKPLDDVTVKGEAYNYWAVDAYDNGEVTTYWGATAQNHGDNRNLGEEVDITLTYDYTEDVQLNLMADTFIPGGAWGDRTNHTASEVLGSMKVTF